ncbi:MAG: hypothetical protein RMI91_01810 [Gemmatales bacterium]|nr:hypothetical protein [Gemmatales bacterium]MDW7993362.1 hypothetical protein [Gemmatales bacterium]
MTLTATAAIHERALEALRHHGNPFRNYFARHPDDEICARYHVPELYAQERELVLAAIDLYRQDATRHSEVLPILGSKGAGKTHLLHSIKHGSSRGRQLVVTPSTYQKGCDFVEFVLFQIIDTLLGGGTQGGVRPLVYIGEELTRRLVRNWLQSLDSAGRAELFPATALTRWARRLGLGSAQAEERCQWLVQLLSRSGTLPVRQALLQVQLEPGLVYERLCEFVARNEVHSVAGQMRRRIYQGFARAILLGQEDELAHFLTSGFTELDFQVQPSRQELVLALLRALMDICLTLRIPVVVAFDQLEDLLLVRRTEDGHRVSESFFAGLVQVLHQVDGICFLIFAERGLWNRFVPSLDGYIQDRLNHPLHLPGHGSVQAIRLDPPPPDLVRKVVVVRLRPALEPFGNEVAPIFPFSEEQVLRIARTEPTLRDMLQQFRRLFDRLVYGRETGDDAEAEGVVPQSVTYVEVPPPQPIPPEVKEVTILRAVSPPHVSARERSADSSDGNASAQLAPLAILERLWHQACDDARERLAPEGAVTGATRELQAGLGALMQTCLEHGVKVGPWRLQHVVPEFTYGQHPTYGVLTLAHWVCRDGPPWRVGVGLFLGRGPGKFRDLQVKLTALDMEPPVVDTLVLLRPADDLQLSGKTKALWEEVQTRGRPVRLEPLRFDELVQLYAFPRWLALLTETWPEDKPLPNLADFLQSQCEALLRLTCLHAD